MLTEAAKAGPGSLKSSLCCCVLSSAPKVQLFTLMIYPKSLSLNTFKKLVFCFVLFCFVCKVTVPRNQSVSKVQGTKGKPVVEFT